MIEFRMPSLGADMEAGTLVEWVKKPGDPVARGDIIAVVDTEKGAIEIEVFDAGVIESTVVEPGAKVPVGTLLAVIRAPGEGPGAPAAGAAASAAAPQPPSAAAPSPAAAIVTRARVSPAARKRAGELQVDVGAIEASGPDGSITVADVERAAARRRAPAAPADRATSMRGAIGAAMARAKREIPHLYLTTTVDLSRSLAWLTAENQRRAVADRLLPVVLFIKAAARACVEVPAVNGFWTESGFTAGAGVHIGCAIALRGGGLVAPALHDVDRKPLDVLARELADLVKRARAGGLRSSEMSDATITVTNLGDLGVESAYAIIHPPQVAILAVGRVVERPWVAEGRIEPRSVVSMSVSADHRATDGREAGLFLAAIDRALQAPESL
ncbi:MAG TPA: dihydrolipoamide acetyltransferase family protein [Vicinamibacterales bacterium]|nr:dihydrolipoamide acetyltransferase family protein [Vicinamibacterales bacterium]